MKFRPDIEGVRALAILLVVTYHGWSWLPGGYLGVDIFFVLSGYLISGLLVAEHERTGQIDLQRFFARRMRRLLPASLLTVAVTAAAAWLLLAPFEQRKLATTAASVAIYSSNLFFALTATDYLGGDQETNPLLHTWSLAVEEQFYLVWPFALVLGARWSGSGRRGLFWLSCLAVCVSFPTCWYFTAINQPLAFFLSPLRAWQFALGGLGVLAPATLFGKRAGLVAGSCLVLLCGCAVAFSEHTSFPAPMGMLPGLATVTLLIAGKDCDEGLAAQLLRSPPAQTLGRLSYSLYLWHWPFLVLAPILLDRELHALEVGAVLLCALAVAEMSYRWVEQPLRHAAVLAPSMRSIGVATGATVSVAAAGIGWQLASDQWMASEHQRAFTEAAIQRPAIYGSCHRNYFETEPVLDDCVFGPDDGTRVVLFGDSHAAHWFPALVPAGSSPPMRITSATKASCNPLLPASWNPRLRRRYMECVAWTENVLEELSSEPPAVLLIGARLGSTGMESQYLPALSEIRRRLPNTALIYLRDVPAIPSPPTSCLSRARWRGWGSEEDCAFSIEPHSGRVADDLLRAAGADHIVEPIPWLCPDGGPSCPSVVAGTPVWRDASHISVAFAEKLSPQVFAEVEIALAARTGEAPR